MPSNAPERPKTIRPLGKRATIALCVAAGAVLLLCANVLLSRASLSDAASTAQSTIAFARQSVKRHEENISSLRTKSTTSVWEKLEELESRFDITNSEEQAPIETYLQKMNLQAAFLLDANHQVAAIIGDETVANSIAAELQGNDALDELVAYPAKSYLSRSTTNGNAYDYAACATSRLEGGIIACVTHVEKSDVDGGQAMFNAMFDNYALDMDGMVVVADEEQVLASNNSELLGISRADFDGRLALGTNSEPERLADGTFDKVNCFGLKTTSNGYDVYVWFPARSVMVERNMALAVIGVLYLFAILAVFVVRINVQNAKLRREHEYLESLERANAAKTDFLRRMSHDVRTPINGIRGMLAIGDHYADDMGKQAECRAKMWEASSFLLELVNSALDMNKLESGQMHFENKPFDLRRTVLSVTDVLQVQADNVGIELTCKMDIDHSHVIGSSLHVRQVLQNIGSNALKYNRSGGSVRLECLELGAKDGRATYRFTSADTGIGMSEEFQRHAFDAFAQEDSSSRSSYRGTGLGLAIAKEIVEQMGGTIELTSVKGEGTTFVIELSFEIDDAPADAAKPSGDEVPLSGMHVLLAEDNELNSEVATFMLEQEGIIVDSVGNGQEALEKFKGSPNGFYDMILMDEMMPVMNGTEAARAIRLLNRPDAQTIPIIAVTANAFSDDRERSAAAGMNGHVSKPLDAQKLTDAIRENRL